MSTTQSTKPSRSSFAVPTGGNNSLLLERTRGGARRATPDSEALASSDDEVEKHHQAQSPSNTAHVKPPRRSSWLNEVQPPPARKGSMAGASSVSPLNSQPNTPATDNLVWATSPGSGMGRSQVPGSSFTWSSAIWNSDSRREPPARLAEVLPSPTSDAPPSLGSSQNEQDLLAGSLVREATGDSTIPFPIPLHPTPKSYRSQSYSVGQLDPDANGALPSPLLGSYFQGRVKAGQPSGLQHRPSRPSMLSELSHESTSLDQVREAEDDNPFADSSLHGTRSTSDAFTVEQLARENAILRQAAATNQLENMRLRNRAASATAPVSHKLGGIGHRIQGSVPEESDYAVDELDDLHELHTFTSRAPSGRRYSEFSVDTEGRYPSSALPENRKVESVRKSYWQSSLGFGGLAEGQQSRRHSFADVPTRNGSVGTTVDHLYSAEVGEGELDRGLGGRDENAGRFAESGGRPSRDDHASHFAGAISPQRNGGSQSSARQSTTRQPSYASTSQYASEREQSPLGGLQRGAFGLPASMGVSQSRQNQRLCVVTFKCFRADVFYVQEGTGLQVKAGDMVIVEADRGTDLGTVVDANVSWERAKQLKEHYAGEHYKWLMMFSRHGAQGINGHGVTSNGLLSANGGPLGSAVGGMGPPGGHHGMQEVGSGELKPKMIKRLAQTHEIQTLRDKEGNEAKAKRVCQQKVAEHRLQMEILDAEFQMDWKKLTFYYFADAYINFNSLVTELFKVYKTRIWMSAINPASFANVSHALPQAVGMGQGSLAFGRHSPYRQQQETIYNGTTPFNGFRSYLPSSDTTPLGDVTPTNPYAYAFQPFGPPPRPSATLNEYAHSLQRQPDNPVEFRPIEFGDLRTEHTQKASDLPGSGEKGPLQLHNEGWMSSFQGLSLHSH